METVQDLEHAIGPRGSTRVNSSNRGLVKRWLTAQGVPGVVARGLPVADLARHGWKDGTDLLSR